MGKHNRKSVRFMPSPGREPRAVLGPGSHILSQWSGGRSGPVSPHFQARLCVSWNISQLWMSERQESLLFIPRLLATRGQERRKLETWVPEGMFMYHSCVPLVSHSFYSLGLRAWSVWFTGADSLQPLRLPRQTCTSLVTQKMSSGHRKGRQKERGTVPGWLDHLGHMLGLHWLTP